MGQPCVLIHAAAVATVDIILFLSFPHNNYHTTPALTLAKLYTNTLVLIFNSRMRIVGGRDTIQSGDIMALKTSRSSRFNPATLATSTGAISAIHVNTGQVATEINVQKDTFIDRSDADIPVRACPSLYIRL